LLKLYRSAGPEKAQPELIDSLLSALQAAVESPLPEPTRRDALRQWVAVVARSGDFGPCVDLLDRHESLLGGEAYLLYARAAGNWRRLKDRPADAQDPPAAEQAAKAAARARAAAAQARKDGLADLSARSALLEATVLAWPPAGKTKEALKVLEDSAELLKQDPATAGPSAWLKVELMMDLGLTEEAVKLLAALPEGTARGKGELLVRLAEAQAQRYSDAGARRQVVELCHAALGASASGQEATYAALARRAAAAMLKVGAAVDAQELLGRALALQAVKDDPAACLDCSLMLGQALQQAGKLDQARRHYKDLAESRPDSPEVHMAAGRLEMQARQGDLAVDAFRRSRRLCREGTAAWCSATLALAEALAADGHAAAAAEILRVSQALHPQFGTAELLAELKKMTETLRQAIAAESPRPEVNR
jgi:hypothetical protein